MDIDIEKHLTELGERGYSVVSVEDIKPLVESRRLVADIVRYAYNLDEGNDAKLLNNIHNLIDIDDIEANRLVMSVIKEYGKAVEMSQVVYECCPRFIDRLIGPDIACQKNPNIVFQYPGSQRISELHTDAPANSDFEVVAWAPLVDCYGTKSFYVIDAVKSEVLKSSYQENVGEETWVEFKENCLKESSLIEAPFGSILFFSTRLLHGSVTNDTNEARWSLNTRYKNLFAPCGLKDPFTFYKVFKTSELTRVATR